MPVIKVIRETDILKEFPGKTEADLYLWVLDHQRYLAEEGESLHPPEHAARLFVDEEVKKPAHKPGRKTRSDKGKKRKK
jgi:hypothetical protein